jgi:2-polyprenyl-3-methyl-5-hydroxy-6-metoxy-1,4-benzoquinol methylase
MMTKEEIQGRLAKLVQEHGEWSFDIPLAHGVWTRGNEKLPHTRLKRVLQIVHDLGAKPISSSRILDLGCLDGIYSIECALHGAEVIGIDARKANVEKAFFAKEALGLTNLVFVEDDVRNISETKYGTFDVIICSGILYHFNTPDVFELVEHMYEIVRSLVIIDTHISLRGNEKVIYNAKQYCGHMFREHLEHDDEATKRNRLLYSFGNDLSFVFTRPSLINLLRATGFSSVYECFNPPHLNFGAPGLEHKDRCTFVAIKGEKSQLFTSPDADTLEEDWPEGSLSY